MGYCKIKSRLALLVIYGILLSGSLSAMAIPGKYGVQIQQCRVSEKTICVEMTNFPIAADSLGFLRKYDGKYPYEVKLLDNPILKKRLEKLLGARFSFMKKTWAVEIPMEVKGNLFTASACQTHNCSSTNFMIVADISRNILYAGIREEGNVKLYAEDGGSNEILDKWAKGY